MTVKVEVIVQVDHETDKIKAEKIAADFVREGLDWSVAQRDDNSVHASVYSAEEMKPFEIW